MKKLAFLLAMLLISAPISGFQTFLDRHGIWLEDNEFSWIGLRKLYSSYTSGYDREASGSSYLNIDFDPDRDARRLYENRYLPVEFTFRDDFGVKFTQLWISWSAIDGRRPQMAFDGENLEGFNNPAFGATDNFIKRGYSYGDAPYRWECFQVPYNLRYAQPTTYRLTLLIEALKPFKMRLDAIYLGNGTIEPQNRNRPLRPGLPVDNPEKVLPWVVPVTDGFDRTMVAPLDRLAKNVDLTSARGMRIPFVLGVTGGLDLGGVTLNIDNPLRNGSETLKTDISTVSFLIKRWFRNAPVEMKTEVAEYLKPGNQVVVSMGKTEFFWVDTIVPETAKPGKYSTRLRIRTDKSSDYEISFTVSVKDVVLEKPDNLMIFHSRNHFLHAKSGKLGIDQAWARYEKDFEDIKAHGIKRICLPLLTIEKPNYVLDSQAFLKLASIAAKSGIKEIYVDIIQAWNDCLKDKSGGTVEFAKSITEVSDILEEQGFKAVYFIGRNLAGIEKTQIDLLDLLGNLRDRPETAATFVEAGNYDPVTRQIFDLGDFDWKYTNANSSKLSWEPRPHWGNQAYAKTISGIVNSLNSPEILAIAEYQSVHGNAFDDFDQRLGDGTYTPGDLAMVYTDESYNFYPSLKWEALRLGLYDWGLIELLSRHPEKCRNFLPSKTYSRAVMNYCTPQWQKDFWSRGMLYFDWTNGGKPVEPIKNTHTIEFIQGSKTFRFDGHDTLMTVVPLMIGGRIYIPAKYLFEPLGGTVSWDQATKTVNSDVLNHNIKLTVNNKNAKVDGKDIDMSSSPVIVSGRTLIPLRDASTFLGADVQWDSQEKTAIIRITTGIRH